MWPLWCQAIELSCNCFDFWPRAFIFPVFPPLPLPLSLSYIVTSRIYRLPSVFIVKCGKNVINNSRCFIAAATQFIWPGLWGACSPASSFSPSFSWSRSWPRTPFPSSHSVAPALPGWLLHCGLLLLCVSFPIKRTQIDDVNNDDTENRWLDDWPESRKPKFLPANRNSAWPTEMETACEISESKNYWINSWKYKEYKFGRFQKSYEYILKLKIKRNKVYLILNAIRFVCIYCISYLLTIVK